LPDPISLTELGSDRDERYRASMASSETTERALNTSPLDRAAARYNDCLKRRHQQ
jgi:hypothetical protein